MKRMPWFCVLIAALLTTLYSSFPGLTQQAKAPRIPAALDPGGVAVALLSTGIDYLQPEIAARLARDGEGEPIAWDFVDNDNRPYLASPNATPANLGGDGTTLARALTNIPEIPTRIVPVRINPDNPATFGLAIAFIARTPATIVVVPMWSARADDWKLFQQMVQKSPRLLFIVAAGDGGADLDKEPVFPAASGLDNVLVVTAVSFADRKWNFQGNWGSATVDAVAPIALLGDQPLPSVSLSGRAAVTAAVATAQALARDGSLSGSKLKEKVLAAAPWQMNESPPRTKTQAVIIAVVAKADQLAPGYPEGLRERQP